MTRIVLRRVLEAPIEARVVRDARRLIGIDSIKLTPRGRRGFNDRLFWVPGGRPTLIEFKKPGGEPEEYQDHVHQTLRALGYDVHVHDTYDGAMACLRAAVEAASRATARDAVPHRTRLRRALR